MSKGKSLPALPPAAGCRVCGALGWTLCRDCAARIELQAKMAMVCEVCGGATDCYNAVRANLHRACESRLPVVQIDLTGMAADMARDNDRKQARLFGYGAR